MLAATEAATHQPTDGPALAHIFSFALLEHPFVFKTSFFFKKIYVM